MKLAIQRALKRAGLYHRTKASAVYRAYWKMVNPRIIDEIDAKTAFYKTVLQGFPKEGLIFDVGANHGRKTGVFLALGARVIAIDPDELNQEILRQKYLSYRLRKMPVTVIGKAVSDSATTETFWIAAPGSGKNTLSQKWVDTIKSNHTLFDEPLTFGTRRDVPTTTLDQLIAIYGHPFFIKIDVEGHELKVLLGLTRSVPFLSFEVNLPEFREEGIKCIKLLHGLSPNGTFNYTIGRQTALALRTWLRENEFVNVFKRCGGKCVEVFWRTTG
jgi:FkbM family methyltransferase